MRCLDNTTDSMNKLQEIENVREALHAVVHGVTKPLSPSPSWTRRNGEKRISQCLRRVGLPQGQWRLDSGQVVGGWVGGTMP